MPQLSKVNQEVSSPKIDLSYLTEITGGDEDFMKSIVSTFVNDAPNTLARLEEYCAVADWWEVGQAAHQLKPSLQFVGLNHTLAQVKTIEQNCKTSSDLSTIPQLVNQVILDIKNGINELQATFSV